MGIQWGLSLKDKERGLYMTCYLPVMLRIQMIIQNGEWKWPNQNSEACKHLIQNTPADLKPIPGSTDFVEWVFARQEKF